MTQAPVAPAPTVVVTGANGLVGARVCAALVARGATVRAVVRRPGTAPRLEGVEERVGNFHDPDLALVPMPLWAAARPPGGGAAVGGARGGPAAPGDYPVTKRDTDAALAGIGGITRVLLRPPAIVGPGETSVWNTLRPADLAADERQRQVVPDRTWSWVHVEDLAALAADLGSGAITDEDDPSQGPVSGGCTPVNVAAGPATWRDYLGTVTRALGLEPRWQDGPAWTGQVLAERAHAWGWKPTIDLDQALAEIESGLRGYPDPRNS